jgi:hypothetical protein
MHLNNDSDIATNESPEIIQPARRQKSQTVQKLSALVLTLVSACASQPAPKEPPTQVLAQAPVPVPQSQNSVPKPNAEVPPAEVSGIIGTVKRLHKLNAETEELLEEMSKIPALREAIMSALNNDGDQKSNGTDNSEKGK